MTEVICNIDNLACKMYGCKHAHPHQQVEGCAKTKCFFAGKIVECIPCVPEDYDND